MGPDDWCRAQQMILAAVFALAAVLIVSRLAVLATG
jgi:hypothetical protein